MAKNRPLNNISIVTSDTLGSCRRPPSGRWLAKEDKVETRESLYGWMVGDVAVYLLAGCFAQGFVVAGLQLLFIHEGDVPEGHVADDVMPNRFLNVVSLTDQSREWQAGTLADSHYCPREIYVMEIVLHIHFIVGSFLHYQHPCPCICSRWC